MNIYENCPQIETERFLIRLIRPEDSSDLMEVYSDKLVLPYFNSDNCHGSNFYCEKKEYMDESIKYWLLEYHENHGFVRFSIIDKSINKAIGTIEIFKRISEDFFTNCGLLRLDLRRDYEKASAIFSILDLVVPPIFTWFDCSMIATKAPIYAIERIEGLRRMNFIKSDESLVGFDGRKYYDYWIITKE